MKLPAIVAVLFLVLQPYPASMLWEGPSTEDLTGVKGLDPEVITGGDVPSGMIDDAFSSLPGYFIENKGQHEDEVGAYYSSGSGLVVSFGASCVAFGIPDEDGFLATTFRVRYETTSATEPVGRDPMSHLTNFLKGDDPRRWATGVRSFREVVYEDVWRDVDVIHRFEGDLLKYDIVVGRGADPRVIGTIYEGQVELDVDKVSGDLLVKTPVGTMRDIAPIAYQEKDGQISSVDCRYVVEGKRVMFSLGAYDPELDLIIDPGLEFGTFFHRITMFSEVVLDSNGDIIVTGNTLDYEIPTTTGVFCQSYSGGWQDALLAKFDRDASNLLLFTFIGGADSDVATTMVLDNSGGYCIAGITLSDNLPTTNDALYRTFQGGFIDAWFISLNKAASTINYCTYLGGSGIDAIIDLEVTSTDQLWIAGFTESTGFPTTNDAIQTTYQGGSTDGFLMRFSLTSKSLAYSTFIGADANEAVYDIELDSNGHVVILSFANSTGFPTTANAYMRTFQGGGDAAVTKMDKDGSRFLFSTFLGGTKEDTGLSLVLDSLDAIWVVGLTASDDFPLTTDAFLDTYNGNENDDYVYRLSSDGRTLEYSTYFAGPSTPGDIDMSLNSTGSPIVVMSIYDGGLCPTTALIPEAPEEINLYVSWVDFDTGRLLNGTYVGGEDIDGDVYWEFMVTSEDFIIVVGGTDSSDFPSTNGLYDDTHNNQAGFILGLTMGVTPWTPPGTPTNLSVELGNRKATISWDPPTDMGHWPFLG